MACFPSKSEYCQRELKRMLFNAMLTHTLYLSQLEGSETADAMAATNDSSVVVVSLFGREVHQWSSPQPGIGLPCFHCFSSSGLPHSVEFGGHVSYLFHNTTNPVISREARGIFAAAVIAKPHAEFCQSYLHFSMISSGSGTYSLKQKGNNI